MGVPEDEKPLVTKSAGWVLVVSTVVPIPVLMGAILVFDTSAISRVVGGRRDRPSARSGRPTGRLRRV
ncbi:MAG: hypothetical protein M3179_07195 [Actinomycetota bacterium]|nr:hypothetical protein [Actinomycetota bacterium]